MRRVPVDKLKTGMEVAHAIYGADGNVLLNKGMVLKASYIVRLKELGVPAVYIQDHRLGELQAEDMISEETRLSSINAVKEVFKQAQSNNSRLAVQNAAFQFRQIVDNIIEDLLDRQELMINLVDIRALDDYTFAHSVNVCVLAVITGLTLNYSRPALRHLGIGALLHDVGKTVVPLHILNKPGKLTPEEMEAMRRHPQLGFDILRMYKGISPLSANIALQHHERYNGSGYPQGLKGPQVHEFARITAIVDVYDALTADRVYRPAYSPQEAFEKLAGSGNFTHDYRLVRAFLSNVAIYPLCTIVKLTSGHIGVVIAAERGCSQQPQVRLLYEPSGKPNRERPVIDLKTDSKYFISSVLSAEELPSEKEGEKPAGD